MEPTITGYRVGDLTLDLQHERVWRGANVIILPKLSYDLLLILVKAAPALVSLDDLLDDVWPGLVVAPETVTQRVKLLRNALGDDSQNPRYVAGMRGRGYRVIAPIQATHGEVAANADTPGPSSAPVARDSTAVPSGAGSLISKRWWPAAAVLFIAMLAVVLWRLSYEETASQQQSSSNPNAQNYYLQALLARESAIANIANPENLRAVETLLNQAIALDPEFAAAYAERATLRFAFFFTNLEITQQQLDLGNADLLMANKLAPAHPKVIAANAFKAAYVELDFAGSLAPFEQSVEAGMNDPIWLGLYSDVLGLMAKPAEEEKIIGLALELDYENPVLQQRYLSFLLGRGRFDKALDTLGFYRQQRPDDKGLQIYHAVNLAYLTGDLSLWRQLEAEVGAFTGPTQGIRAGLPNMEPSLVLHAQYEWLRIDHRYAELLQVIEQYPSATLRPTFISSGLQPKASLAGWVHLLMGNAGAAAQSGEEIAQFLATTEAFPQHRFFRTILEAEAALFKGDHVQAIALADMLDRELPPNIALRAAVPALYAWAGAHDKAVAILQMVSNGDPIRVMPGRLLLDPLFSAPLANHAEFQILKARLEEEMHSIRLPESLQQWSLQ